eukprot:GHVL01003215.1.p1 GENE.GHVL01003215.1~~GHVL01003215.1.p1  ORF type:complete len:209 (-),score=34.54 GHVL01003215.1:94-720(-)
MAYHRVHDKNALQTEQEKIQLEFKMVFINECFSYFFIVLERLQKNGMTILNLKEDDESMTLHKHSMNQWGLLASALYAKTTTKDHLQQMYENPIGLINSHLEDPATSVLNTIQVNAKDDLNTLQRSKAKISDEEKDEALKLLKDMIEGSAVYMAFVDSFKRLRTQEALENEVRRLMEEYQGKTPFDTNLAQFRIYLDKGDLLGPIIRA